MIIKTKYLIFILVSFILIGCSTDIELKKYIDKSAPFQLNIYQTNLETGQTTMKTIELSVNSEKWKRLIEWTESNKEGWKTTPASYIADISIIQDDFRLLYWKGLNGVIIGFTNEKGKGEQYRKEIKKGELDFLIK